MSKFQIILLAVFGAFILLAVILFSFARGGSSSQVSRVTIWGDISAYDWATIYNSTFASDKSVNITYEEKASDTLSQEFTDALAEGRGPDILITTQDKLWKERKKLTPIPYTSISQRDFQTAFIEEAELYFAPEGIYALPLSVDPLVMYYNRDLLTKAGITKPMVYWDEIYDQSAKIRELDPAGNITKSTMALGEAKNIPHFKDILSLLMLEAGTPIVQNNAGKLDVLISSNFDLPQVPAQSALDFYTQFSNPAKPFYNWNRSQLSAETTFTSGDSAYYLGYASEYRILKTKNPNLNFGVARVPQSRVSGKFLTFGLLKGASIVKSSRNQAGALTVIMKLASKDVAGSLAQTMVLPPARRDLLGVKQSDPSLSVFYESAIQAKGWLDPDSAKTKSVFSEMIESVTSGRARVSEAVNKAQSQIESLAN